LIGRDTPECTGVEIDYSEATGHTSAPTKLRLPGMFDDQGTLVRYDFLERSAASVLRTKAGLGIFPKHPTLAIHRRSQAQPVIQQLPEARPTIGPS